MGQMQSLYPARSRTPIPDSQRTGSAVAGCEFLPRPVSAQKASRRAESTKTGQEGKALTFGPAGLLPAAGTPACW